MDQPHLYMTADEIATKTNLPRPLCRRVAKLKVGPFRGSQHKRVCRLDAFHQFMDHNGALLEEILPDTQGLAAEA